MNTSVVKVQSVEEKLRKKRMPKKKEKKREKKKKKMKESSEIQRGVFGVLDDSHVGWQATMFVLGIQVTISLNQHSIDTSTKT